MEFLTVVFFTPGSTLEVDPSLNTPQNDGKQPFQGETNTTRSSYCWYRFGFVFVGVIRWISRIPFCWSNLWQWKRNTALVGPLFRRTGRTWRPRRCQIFFHNTVGRGSREEVFNSSLQFYCSSPVAIATGRAVSSSKTQPFGPVTGFRKFETSQERVMKSTF